MTWGVHPRVLLCVLGSSRTENSFQREKTTTCGRSDPLPPWPLPFLKSAKRRRRVVMTPEMLRPSFLQEAESALRLSLTLPTADRSGIHDP